MVCHGLKLDPDIFISDQFKSSSPVHARIRKGRRWMVVGGHGRRGPTQVRRTKREGMNECLHSKVAVDLWSGWWCVPLDPVSSHVSSVATIPRR